MTILGNNFAAASVICESETCKISKVLISDLETLFTISKKTNYKIFFYLFIYLFIFNFEKELILQ